MVATSDLYVRTFGTRGDRPPAVFLHDFMADSRLFDKLLADGALLPSQAQCAAYDMRGFGNSPDPTEPYSRADDLTAVRAELADAPCHLVGCGLGGTVAMEYALSRPRDVLSLALISPGLTGHSWRRGDLAFFELPTSDKVSLPVEDGASSTRLGRPGAREWVKQSVEWRAALKKGGPIAQLLQDMFRSYKCFHFWGDDVLVPDPYEGDPLSLRIKDLDVPVLVMVGAEEDCRACEDFVFIAREILEAVPKPAFGDRSPRFLADAGHFGAYEASDECSKLISELWAVTTKSNERQQTAEAI